MTIHTLKTTLVSWYYSLYVCVLTSVMFALVSAVYMSAHGLSVVGSYSPHKMYVLTPILINLHKFYLFTLNFHYHSYVHVIQ